MPVFFYYLVPTILHQVNRDIVVLYAFHGQGCTQCNKVNQLYILVYTTGT